MKRNISLQELINDVEHTAKQCKNLQPLLDEVSMLLEYKTQESFEMEHDAFGKKWAPLSQQTKKTKRSKKILRESGILQSSITSRTNSKQGSTQGSVSIGTPLAYAPIHQFGGKAGRGRKVNIPARPFLPMKDNAIPEDVQEDIKEAIARFFKIGK